MIWPRRTQTCDPKTTVTITIIKTTITIITVTWTQPITITVSKIQSGPADGRSKLKLSVALSDSMGCIEYIIDVTEVIGEHV